MDMKQMIFMAVVLLMLVASCDRQPNKNNFPPDNANVALDSTNLPIVWVEVDGVTVDRFERIPAHMKIIYNGKGNLNYADTVAHPGQSVDYEGPIALRYRGNSSLNASDKKPYSFRTLEKPLKKSSKKKKVEILGLGKDNNWALLAPYSDKSMMRDLLAFELARPWMEYVPQGRYCELFLDGTYYGVYILCEVVSKGKHRLNLAKPGTSGDALTGDYLVEVDYDDDVNYVSKYHPVDSLGRPITDRFVHFQFKSPEIEKMKAPQIAYITTLIDEMERVMASPQCSDPQTGYRKYIDVTSFIDYQLAMELGHNIDGYRKSGKFYKRRDSGDGRFKMVVWDMNIAYGNCKIRDGWRTDTWIYQSNDLMRDQNEDLLVPFWWYRLNGDKAYVEQLKARWAQYRNTNLTEERVMAVIDSLATELTSCGAEQRNSQAWPRWGEYVWPNYYIAKDFNDEIAHLKQWVKDRIAWMDERLGYRRQ